MTTSSALFRCSVALRILVLSALLTLGLAPARRLPVVADVPLSLVENTSVGAPTDVVGSRIGLGKIGCLGCAGMVIGMGWGSVVGSFLVMAAWPEYVVLCGMGCLKAFG